MSKGRPVDVELSIKRMRKQIQFVKENIHIGTVIKAKVNRRAKGEYNILKLDRIEGIHYIFVNKFGWIQSYTMTQLMVDIADGYIKILKGDNKND